MAVRLTSRRIGKLLIVGTILQLTTSILAVDSPKRAPSGFTGVRGKKSYSQYDDNDFVKNQEATLEHSSLSKDNRPETSDSINSDIDDGENIGNYLTDYSNKRGPMGFVGMRGKKEALHKYNYQDALNREIEKIRFNCKLYPDNLQCGNYKPETIRPLNLETTQINSEDLDEIDNDLYLVEPIQQDKIFARTIEFKRAPVGFMGMRGKKYTDEGVFLKRAPSTGFMGMRGKKTLLQYSPTLQVFDDPEQVIGDSAFVSKRAPANGFFGMRGKKMPGNSGFFGMRGKKGPYDFPFRGKFVGVRGKKSVYDAPDNHIDGSASRLE